MIPHERAAESLPRSRPLLALFLGGLAAILLTGLRPAAALATPLSFDIPAQDLAGALRQAALQSGRQIAFDPALVQAQRAMSLKGAFELDVALERLLAGTGLRHRRDANGTILVDRVRAAPAASNGLVSDENLLDEVMVTADRRLTALGKLPMTVYALAQPMLDRENIHNMQDLAVGTPGMTFRQSTTDNSPSIAIRGIASTTGAATTGILLDDTPLQKRNVFGTVNGNGSPVPQIFDLQRVEVLLGPQGTLYGSSSEGGTIRFVTPSPSLNTYAAIARTQVSTTEGGTLSYEAGAVVGGPLIVDRLGVRLSAWGSHSGGYIDHLSRLNGTVLATDTNSTDSQAFRLAVTLAPTSQLTFDLSLYASDELSHDVDSFWQSIPAYTNPARSYNAAGALVSPSSPTAVFSTPSHTYGPFNFGPFKSGLNTDVGEDYANSIPEQTQLSPRDARLSVNSLATQWRTPKVEIKAITSYVADRTSGVIVPTYFEPLTFSGSPFIADLREYAANFYYDNRRWGATEEIRASSPAGAEGVRWVAGVFYSNTHIRSHAFNIWNVDQVVPIARGISDVAYYGAPLLPGNVSSIRDQELTEDEAALFGELVAPLGRRMKLTGGVRVTLDTFSYFQSQSGQTAGFLLPTPTNGGITRGSKTEAPISPRLVLSYDLEDRGLLYASATKGFRIGGVNPPVSQVKCQDDLKALGSSTTPPDYNSDNLWEYELGAKLLALGGGVQVNSSLFYIDWRNVQINAALPTCGFSYTINGAGAVSKGANFVAQATPWRGVRLYGQLAYTDAHYSATVYAPPSPTGAKAVILNGGDALLGVPTLAFSLGGEYSRELGAGYEAYAKLNYDYSGPYHRTFGPGATTYSPDSYSIGAANYVALRFGLKRNGWEAALLLNNLLDSRDILQKIGGRSGCPTAACINPAVSNPILTENTFRPRTIGLQMNYHY